MKKKHKHLDPFAAREAQNYSSPIASREYLLSLIEARGNPVLFEEIADELALVSEDNLEALRRRLIAMERDGQIIRNRRGGYGLLEKMGLVRGRVISHRDGFGFLVSDDGGKDLFLPERQMRALFDGDRVVARISGVDRRGRYEAAVVEVLERGVTSIIGRFVTEAGTNFVLPDNPRIRHQVLIPPEHTAGAVNGQIVMVELVSQPTKWSYPIGKVSAVLGEHMAPGMEIDIAIQSHQLPHVWSESLLDDIKSLKATVATKDKADRLDLRDLPLVTIDGDDARDFDDAVYCERTRQGWTLWVCIADVSHYVRPGTALDAAALERGNSVYFPERVIPMLPEILSNELCSLKPKVDRLCMACEISLSKTGEVKSYRFHNALMRSKARLTYTVVSEVLTTGHAKDVPENLIPHIKDMHDLYCILKAARDERGAIDFDMPETKIIFGSDRKIEKIVSTERNDAHRLIEEFMLMANVCAARYLLAAKIPALYRNHAGPTVDKLVDVRKFLGEMGLKLLGGDEPSPQHYAKVLKQAAKRNDANLIQMVMLRSLAQAAYQSENQGHFGLAYEAYTHFTSPIRRYPDLLVHRAIKHILAKGKPKTFLYDADKMAKFGGHSSMTERRADDATRDVTSWLKCEFMLDKVGQSFDGIISGVNAFGLFVTLKDIFVDGLVHITALKNDYYHFDPIHHRLSGERTGTMYCIGDSMRVRVARVNLDDRKIDFELSDTLSSIQKKRGSPRKFSEKK